MMTICLPDAGAFFPFLPLDHAGVRVIADLGQRRSGTPYCIATMLLAVFASMLFRSHERAQLSEQPRLPSWILE